MWDNTDVRLKTPAHSNLQRTTYLDYYRGNVGKGITFLLLCGWLGTHELWEGAVSDTNYFRQSGILQLQDQYVDLYNSNTVDIKWTNILDRGYKVIGKCFANGQQHVLQPHFSHPGFVASDRGGNKKAAQLAKLS